MSSSSRVDPAAAEDAPAPAAAAAESYDAQLAAMKSMRARGASADEMRAAAAKLNHLKRALFVPRYTSSRKTAKLEKSSSTPRRRAMQGPRVRCPACGHDVKASHPDQFRHHVAKCCPDAVRVVPKDAWTDPAVAADAMATRESTLAEEAKLLAYGPEKLASLDDVAAALELTPRRLRLLLRRASLAVPLVADEERLEVIHEDDAILVVNKPPGLRFHPVHRFEGNSLLSRCIGHIRRRRRRRRRAIDDGGEDGGEDADADGEEKVDDDEDAHADDMPHIVHRLDMDTSGVCVFVKDKSLVDGFARQFRGDDAGVKKEYVALAVGTVPRGEVVAFSSEAEEVRDDDDDAAAAAAAADVVGRAFVVDAHIGDHATMPEARAVHPPPLVASTTRATDPSADASAPKPATTACVVSSSAAARDGLVAALVRCAPRTGRTHQIRLHLALANLPILSDPLYGPHVRFGGAAMAENARGKGGEGGGGGGGGDRGYFAAEPEGYWGGDLWLGRQALHAASLTVRHPKTDVSMTFRAPLPEDMRRACVALGVDPDA